MLRELHEGVVDALETTFPGVDVRPHVGEVDRDTIRRFALGRVSMLVTIAASQLEPTSALEQLRSTVSVGVFVIAGAVDVQADGGKPEPVLIAQKYVEKLQALAALNTWLLDDVAPVEPSTIVARNLGVGLKSDRETLESGRLSLWVVWWDQSVGFGQPLVVGEQAFPLAEMIDGVLEDGLVPDEAPQIGVQQPLSEEP